MSVTGSGNIRAIARAIKEAEKAARKASETNDPEQLAKLEKRWRLARVRYNLAQGALARLREERK